MRLLSTDLLSSVYQQSVDTVRSDGPTHFWLLLKVWSTAGSTLVKCTTSMAWIKQPSRHARQIQHPNLPAFLGVIALMSWIPRLRSRTQVSMMILLEARLPLSLMTMQRRVFSFPLMLLPNDTHYMPFIPAMAWSSGRLRYIPSGIFLINATTVRRKQIWYNWTIGSENHKITPRDLILVDGFKERRVVSRRDGKTCSRLTIRSM